MTEEGAARHEPLTLTLMISVPSAGRPAGVLADAGGTAEFSGWMELVALIDARLAATREE